jgi:hypothetical protein
MERILITSFLVFAAWFGSGLIDNRLIPAMDVAYAALPTGVPVQNTGMVSSSSNPTASIPFFQDSDATYQTFTLVAGSTANTVTNDYYPFYRDGTAYATPSDKKVYCKNFVGGGSTAYLGWQIVTSTAAITFAQSTALTSAKYQCGADQRPCMATLNTAANTWSPIPGGFVGGDGATVTYLGMQAFSSAQSMIIQMICYEK